MSGLMTGCVAAGQDLAAQALTEGYHRAPFTLTNETMTVVEEFIILDAAFNFTLFVACNETTGFLRISITRESAPDSLIQLSGGTNTTRSFVSGGFGVSLYSNGTSLGYYWYDAHIQGGWPTIPPLLWLIGIVLVVVVLSIAYIVYRRK